MSVDVEIELKPGVTVGIKETPRGFLVQKSTSVVRSRGRMVGSAGSASILAALWAGELGASAEDLEKLRAVGREKP
ncbi:MAG: hypothetical protein JJ863_21550 [Deltaproteobacteria bacterium]|nr:hypothetical protein [Deltaproteobacteria bacterium]